MNKPIFTWYSDKARGEKQRLGTPQPFNAAACSNGSI